MKEEREAVLYHDSYDAEYHQQFKDADEDRRAAGALKTEYEGRLAGADEESARLIADAKVTAKAKADKIVDQAKLTSDKMVRDAHQTIEHERNEDFGIVHVNLMG